LETDLLQEFLPDLLLDNFEVAYFFKLGNISSKKIEFEIHLDEQNNLPPGYSKSEYESKGFLPASRIQDFPIRSKAV